MKLTISAKLTKQEAEKLLQGPVDLNDRMRETLADELAYGSVEVVEVKDDLVTVRFDSTITDNSVGNRMWDKLAAIADLENYGYYDDYGEHLPCVFEDDNLKQTNHQDGSVTIAFTEEYSV